MAILKNEYQQVITVLALGILCTLFYHGCRSSEIAVDEEINPDFVLPVPEQRHEPVPLQELTPLADIPSPMEEFRGVWVATVANIDWPSQPGLPVEKQKEELITLLDRAASLHFNAIIFQVRPAADAMYNSPIEPWSYYLTGKMGRAPLPEFDPLEFVIREAHQRGLELHAWFNPYRAGHPTDRSEVSPDHVSKTNPDDVVEYGDFLWLDPGSNTAREHTIAVIMDVVQRYNIDGVHFDDYFYPYPSYADGADFPDEKSWQFAEQNGNTLSRGDWRRNNVNRLMKELSERIKQEKPHVKFGISPFGVWRPGFPENTTGFDAYENLYADARLWLKEGWVDYFTPQIYYRIDQTAQPFPVMLEWWVEQNDYKRHVWPGLYTSRIRTTDTVWPAEEIVGQMYTTRGFPEVSGAVHFSMKVFLENSYGFNQKIASGAHARPSVIPPSPWMDAHIPSGPQIEFNDYGDYYALHLSHESEDTVRWWNVKTRFGDTWEYKVVPGTRKIVQYFGGISMIRPDEILVSVINRFGNESEPVRADLSQEKETNNGLSKEEKPSFIKRMEWGNVQPRGVHANAIRRNILQRDTLRFNDITILFDGIVKSMPFPGELLKVPQTASDVDTEEKETIILQLFKNGVKEQVRVEQGEAFNWYGYHIGIIGADFSSGMVQLEIATVPSLSVDRAAFRGVGTARDRLRVPHRVQSITLHHTGSPQPLKRDSDPEEVLRNLYKWGVEERNWWDVPYHYLIDLDGTIYEGRDEKYAGETNTMYDPRGHFLISVMGNYNQQQVTNEQLQSIAELMAYAIKKYNLVVEDIGIHQEFADTSCPGVYLKRFFDDGSLIHMVKENLTDQ